MHASLGATCKGRRPAVACRVESAHAGPDEAALRPANRLNKPETRVEVETRVRDTPATR
jgi:hypothetical protein